MVVSQPLVKCGQLLLPNDKTLGSVVDHSPPSSPEVKNEWSYTSIAPLHSHVVEINSFDLIFLQILWNELVILYYSEVSFIFCAV